MKSHRVSWTVVMLVAAFVLCQVGWSTANAQVIQLRVALHIDEKHPVYSGGQADGGEGGGAHQGPGKDYAFPQQSPEARRRR